MRLPCKSNDNPFLLRYRSGVIERINAGKYRNALTVVWIYADENTRSMPNIHDSQAMSDFEDHLISHLEIDRTAVLTAVLTFDGARQWVYYTDDVEESKLRINRIGCLDSKCPIEIGSFEDHDWLYLRDKIIRDRK